MGHARIGRVRMKNDGAEIIPLRPGASIENVQRDNFTAHVAASFNSYSAKYGEEPDAMVLVLGGLKQSGEAFWIIRGDSQGGATSMLAFAQATIQREISR
jgi:hypothetical protein